MKKIAATLILVLLTACGGGGSDTPEDGRKTIDRPDCAASAACA
jgi:hypothetical protein